MEYVVSAEIKLKERILDSNGKKSTFKNSFFHCYNLVAMLVGFFFDERCLNQENTNVHR